MSEPLTYYAPGTGILSSRSGWGADDAQFILKAGAVRESHEDRAVGTFYLFRDGWLAGTAKLQSHSGIDQDCWDHNCVSVDGKSQAWTQNTCQIVRYESNSQYTYAMCDLAGAYPNQLSAYYREVFFLLPNFLLVADGYVPVNPSSTVTFHLNTPLPPVLNRPGFQAGPLYGTVIEPGLPALTSQIVKLAPEQATPTYRIDVQGDSTGHFLVALEAAPAGQVAATLGASLANADVQGIRCGLAFVGWLSGGRSTWSYASPVGGRHYLIGTPNTQYQTPAGSQTSTAAGLLVLLGQVAGQSVTISKGVTPQPQPQPQPQPKGRTFSLFVPAVGAPVIQEIPTEEESSGD